jgi:putative DNA primase/helicase
MEEFVKILQEDLEKFGKVDDDGNIIIDSGIQKQKVGSVRKEEVRKKIEAFFTKEDLAEQIWDVQPYFYDKSKMWWLWDCKEKYWELADETEILIMVSDNSYANTVSAKEKSEILESMKQYGRKKIPLPIKSTWIQFKDLLVDIKTGDEFEATPRYFVTNPIPWELHKERFVETPTMDKIFAEWVGKENVQQLYEILAYCLIPDYPIHRIFCFIGSGMNGKSKYLELLRKFIGNHNCASTELDTLLNSRFEVTRLHKKLVCQMGETNFNEMNKTSLLKKLSGGDLIGFEYKNKDPFEEMNYAKILIATNNLPTTTDKTIGFYRRWMIIDFPNQFSEKKDILGEIPNEEYEILAVKLLGVLKDLLQERTFHNEGTIEQRKEKYEAKSNFLEIFLEQFTIEDINQYITKADFFKKFSSWCKENRHREMSETSVGLQMKKLGVESDKKHFHWLHDGKGGQARIWRGIKWKE